MKTYYKLFIFEIEEPFELWEIGGLWFITIITFPIWIWFYLFYRLFLFMGKKLNGVKIIER